MSIFQLGKKNPTAYCNENQLGKYKTLRRPLGFIIKDFQPWTGSFAQLHACFRKKERFHWSRLLVNKEVMAAYKTTYKTYKTEKMYFQCLFTQQKEEK